MARKNQQRALREAAERAAQQQEILAIADATAPPNLATTDPSPGDVGQTVAIVSTTIRPAPTAA